MNETVRVQSGPMRAVGAVTVGLAVLLAAGLLVTGAWFELAAWSGPIGLLALTGVAAFWLPYVEVSDGYVELRNVTRTVRLPWPAIQDVDGRYGLKLSTAYGTVTAWAAQAPAGRARMHRSDSHVAAEVRRRLDVLRDTGRLADPRLESETLPARWHADVLTVGGLLVVLTVVGLLAR